MSTGTTSSTSRAATEFLSAGTRLGREFLGLLADPGALAAEASSTAERARSAVGRLTSSSSCGCGRAGRCDIPDPCWMPRRLARVTSPACPGATASLRIRVTNCGLGARRVEVAVSGEHAKTVSVSPESATVDTFETQTFVAKATVPDEGSGFDVLVWVRGCRDHAIPWTVAVSKHGCDTCHEVAIDDCPDLVHHWYDHFYCERPCPHGQRGVATHG